MESLLGWIILIIIVVLIIKSKKPYNEEELNRQLEEKTEKEQNLICPHCQTKGMVTTEKVKKKTGISGAKATGAILTCGVSLLGTGLSRKDMVTEARCSNCGQTWYF